MRGRSNRRRQVLVLAETFRYRFREPRGGVSEMKIVAELLGRLERAMQVVKDQLAGMDGEQLDALVQLLAPTSSVGSAEMVLTILAFREIEARNRPEA